MKLERYLKVTVLMLGFLLTSSCRVGAPSPLKTGSWWYGEVDRNHMGFDVVFPWADRKPKVEPKVNRPE